MDTIVFYLHLMFLGIAALGILYADSLAMSWIRGKKEMLELVHLSRAHTIVSVALLGLVLSGSYMFWPMRHYLIHEPLFLLKIGFVVALIINSFFIDEFMHIARHNAFANLTHRERVPLFISGAISTLCWFGAAITALYLFYF